MFLIRRIISPLTRTLYMTRVYLFGAPRMPDGSYPFDEFGSVRDGAVKPKGWQGYLHRIARSDERGELHNHPWRWGVAIILWGGYYEHRRIYHAATVRFNDIELKGSFGCYCVVVRRVRPGSIVFLRNDDFHRVELVDGRPSYSLFIAGPPCGRWGFRKDGVGPFVPAHEYTRRKMEGK